MNSSLTHPQIVRFKKVVAGLTDSVSIIIAQPDPDGIASAYALAQLIRDLRTNNGIKINIFYAGTISHPQNVALMNRYDLARRVLSMKRFVPAEHGKSIILVDSSAHADARIGVELQAPVIIIDHHRAEPLKESEDTFTWVEDMGACATLIVELATLCEFDFARHTDIAALLAVGIHTDTEGMIHAHERDVASYSKIAQLVDRQELAQLFNYPLPPSYFENLKHALVSEKREGSNVVTNIGIVPAEQGDDLSTIADAFIRRSGVTLVVVWGIIGNAVRISARNTDISQPLDMFLKACFGPTCGAKLTSIGKGVGGGMLSLELGIWSTPDTREQVIAMVDRYIASRIFKR